METDKITQALVKAMGEIKGVEKNANVGFGNSFYKGVNDKDVKEVIRKAMMNNGLAIIPLTVNATTHVERWEESAGQYGNKRKQSVMTEVDATYRLLHTSGQYLDIAGIGHGIDTQDKSAGKATTYALKYALLYTFLVPTGDIDDSDMTHSDAHDVPKKAVAKPAPKPTMSVEQAIERLTLAKNMEELKTHFKSLPASLQKDNEVSAMKDELKEKFTNEEPVIE